MVTEDEDEDDAEIRRLGLLIPRGDADTLLTRDMADADADADVDVARVPSIISHGGKVCGGGALGGNLKKKTFFFFCGFGNPNAKPFGFRVRVRVRAMRLDWISFLLFLRPVLLDPCSSSFLSFFIHLFYPIKLCLLSGLLEYAIP